MKAKTLFALMVGLYLLALSTPASSQKLRLGSALKVNPQYYLTVYAAEEKGFWRENGLEVEWLPFEASPTMYRAVSAKELFMGMDAATSTMILTYRGVPIKIVSELDRAEGIILWVLAKSAVKNPKELKGRIGVITLGGMVHSYAQVALKTLGQEKEVKFVGAGGVGPTVAALKLGSIDAAATSFFNLMDLKVKGEVRDLFSFDDYLPKPWLGRVVWAHKDLIKEKPDTVRRMVRAILQATRFWGKDSAWAIAKIKSTVGISEEGAREIYKISRPSEDGRIERKAIENISAFLTEYNLVSREKAPSLDELYTGEFVPPR